MSRFAALLLSTVLWAAPAIARADGVRGHIRDTWGRGVAGVNVSFLGAAGSFVTRSNTRGFYALLSLPPGTYQAFAYNVSFTSGPCGLRVDVEPNAVTDLDVEVTTTQRVHSPLEGLMCRPVGTPAVRLLDSDSTADVYNIH